MVRDAIINTTMEFIMSEALLHESCFGYACRMLFFVQFLFSIRSDWGLPQMDHSIEDGTAYTAFDLLIGLAPRLECAADAVLIAIDERFGQRASMIATFLFPPLRPFCRIGRRDFIPRQRRCFTIPMLLDYRVFAQGNDRLNWGTARWRGQRVEHLLSIIGPIAPYGPPPPRRLEKARGLPAKHHRSDATSTSGRPPRR